MLMSNGAGALDGSAQGDLVGQALCHPLLPICLVEAGGGRGERAGGVRGALLLSRKYFKITSHFTALYTLHRHSFWSGDGGVM